jgi:hypothetical protein
MEEKFTDQIKSFCFCKFKKSEEIFLIIGTNPVRMPPNMQNQRACGKGELEILHPVPVY